MSDRTFRALEPTFTGIEALILNGIGEPLLHPRLEESHKSDKRDVLSFSSQFSDHKSNLRADLQFLGTFQSLHGKNLKILLRF